MRILLTGATGFFGRRLLRDARAAGHDVIAVVRPSSDTSGLDGARLCRFDGIAAEDFDAVVLAAGGGRVRDDADAEATNVAPTRAVLEAIGSRDVPVVFLSSVAAGGPRGPDRSPADAPDAPTSAYGRSKLRAEALVRSRGMILRVPILYGPGDDRWAPLLRAASWGVVPILGRERTTSVLHVADLSALVLRMLAAPRVGTWYADDGHVHTWADIAGALGHALGRSVRPVVVPVGALPWAAALMRRIGGREFLTEDKLVDALHPHWVCGEPRPDVDWKPAYDLRRGFEDMAAVGRQPSAVGR